MVTGPGAGGPAGIPISGALSLPAGPAGDPLRAAVAAIDRVHGDGALPPIIVRRPVLPPGHEGYFEERPLLQIVVGRSARHPGLTLLHEIGHALDHLGLGHGAVIASSSAGALLDGWRNAVRATRALAELRKIAETSQALSLAKYAHHLAEPAELWARSYAQYVITKSGDPVLQAELDDRRRRSPRAGIVYIPEQWDNPDFVPIAEEITDCFRSLEWIA